MRQGKVSQKREEDGETSKMENIRSSSNSRDHGKKERLQKPDESL